MRQPDPDAPALQALVAAEDAAVFGVSALGGRLADLAPGSAPAAALAAAYDVHRLRRDAWTAALRAVAAPVPAAEPAYQLPAPAGVAGTTMAAADLELRCAAAYDSALEGLADRTVRAQVIAALTDSARRSAALARAAGASPAAATRALPGRDQ